jgi:hypothetical protein
MVVHICVHLSCRVMYPFLEIPRTSASPVNRVIGSLGLWVRLGMGLGLGLGLG